eukprot:TRINITY_DN3108_c0_g1_i10.p1 TRINITY_DN3108_c0_g1~~TRINITY_DN3108_c0_g1_i10.p1  ORF type:complete len:809 (-),score=163.38 TRINITY_DN3108_c0_g1_i10:144-2570(-)
MQRDREKSRTKVQGILTSNRFWTEPSFFMIKSRKTVANVYKVTQTILAGSLMTKSRINRLTGQGSIVCNKCEAEAEETIIHALGECKAHEEQWKKLKEAVLKLAGNPKTVARWPIIIDQTTREERENGELMKGILAGGIPVEWKEVLMKVNRKKALETACRLSAMISKTVAAIWGSRIGGERNDLVDFYNKRNYNINLRAEAAIDEYYHQQQISWEALDKITEGSGLESISEILDSYYREMGQTQVDEGKGVAEEVIGDRIKRRRLGNVAREKWDKIPGLHVGQGEQGDKVGNRQHFEPPEIGKGFSKKYIYRHGCEHEPSKACEGCAKEARKKNEEKRKLKNRKRKEIEREERNEINKRRKGEQTAGDQQVTQLEIRKGNRWRSVATWGIIINAEEDAGYRSKEGKRCKYNTSFAHDKAPLKLRNNRMRAYGGYTRPMKKYKRPMNNNRSLQKLQEDKRKNHQQTGTNIVTEEAGVEATNTYSSTSTSTNIMTNTNTKTTPASTTSIKDNITSSNSNTSNPNTHSNTITTVNRPTHKNISQKKAINKDTITSTSISIQIETNPKTRANTCKSTNIHANVISKTNTITNAGTNTLAETTPKANTQIKAIPMTKSNTGTKMNTSTKTNNNTYTNSIPSKKNDKTGTNTYTNIHTNTNSNTSRTSMHPNTSTNTNTNTNNNTDTRSSAYTHRSTTIGADTKAEANTDTSTNTNICETTHISTHATTNDNPIQKDNTNCTEINNQATISTKINTNINTSKNVSKLNHLCTVANISDSTLTNTNNTTITSTNTTSNPSSVKSANRISTRTLR